MHCEKCGTELPKDAVYCYECGAKVGQAKKRFNKESISDADKKKYALLGLVAICIIILLITFIPGGDKDDKADYSVPENAMYLQGRVVVGPGEDLEAGRYDIYGVSKDRYLFIRVQSGDYDGHINDKGVVRSYNLRNGDKLDIRYEAAFVKLD